MNSLHQIAKHSDSQDRCYICGKPFRSNKRYEVDTRDGQIVWVGPDCFKHVMNAGEGGYAPLPPGYVKFYPMPRKS